MRKLTALFFIFAIACAFGSELKAQNISVVSVSKNKDTHNFYTMMQEAFPLAYNDPASPRFIFFDKDKKFIFGVGGYVQVSGVYDFNGVPDYNDFVTYNIPMKGAQPGGSYGITIGQSRLFFKLVGDTKVGRLVSYMEMEFEGPSQTPILQQAFVKFRGFTVGKTWSTFGDMAAVPATIDEEGPSSGIEIRQPMIRYTHDFNKKWQASLALEYVVPSFTEHSNNSTSSIRQRIPDIPLNVKYSFTNGGHLQAGAILRNMYYKDNLQEDDKIATGWGTTLSGTLNLCKKTSFMFQGVYGKGIANYIQDISGQGYDLVPNPTRNGRLKAANMWGAFAAIQQNWNKNLYSSLVYSYARVEKMNGLEATDYKYAQYAAVNLFWNFSDFGSTGIEYVYGRRNNFNKEYGNASRINTMIQYRF